MAHGTPNRAPHPCLFPKDCQPLFSRLAHGFLKWCSHNSHQLATRTGWFWTTSFPFFNDSLVKFTLCVVEENLCWWHHVTSSFLDKPMKGFERLGCPLVTFVFFTKKTRYLDDFGLPNFSNFRLDPIKQILRMVDNKPHNSWIYHQIICWFGICVISGKAIL